METIRAGCGGTSCLPEIMAHRGLSARAPENTLTAIQLAHEANITWVELDVQLLVNNIAVIWHDNGIKRCSNGSGQLADLTLADIAHLDVGSWFAPRFAGERMATLDAALALIAELNMGLNLELKVHRGRDPRALARHVLPRVLDALPVERVILSSFNGAALDELRALQPDPQRLRLGLLYKRIPWHWRRDADRLAAYSVHADWRRLGRHSAQAVAASPCKLICYTVNDVETFRRLRSWGVDAIISDDPPRLQDDYAMPSED